MTNIFAYSTSETKKVEWLIDSGATSHITNNINDFAFYKAAKIPGLCSVAGKDMVVKILSEGTVILKICTNGEYNQVTLTNVLYIPDATMRFFAPRKILSNNCISEISQNS